MDSKPQFNDCILLANIIDMNSLLSCRHLPFSYKTDDNEII